MVTETTELAVFRNPNKQCCYATILVPGGHWFRIRKEYFAHAPKIGAGKGSRFLVLTKKNAASADGNATQP